MALTAKEIAQLQELVAIAANLLAEAELTKTSGSQKSVSSQKPRSRRSGKDMAAFKKMLKAERAKGVSVSELAKKYGISTSYIYQIA